MTPLLGVTFTWESNKWGGPDFIIDNDSVLQNYQGVICISFIWTLLIFYLFINKIYKLLIRVQPSIWFLLYLKSSTQPTNDYHIPLQWRGYCPHLQMTRININHMTSRFNVLFIFHKWINTAQWNSNKMKYGSGRDLVPKLKT